MATAVLDGDSDLLTGKPIHLAYSRFEQYFDSLAREVLQNCLRDIRIFLEGKLPASLDQGYRRPEAAQGLREFEANVSSTEDHDVVRQTLEVHSFDVSHGFCRRQT